MGPMMAPWTVLSGVLTHLTGVSLGLMVDFLRNNIYTIYHNVIKPLQREMKSIRRV